MGEKMPRVCPRCQQNLLIEAKGYCKECRLQYNREYVSKHRVGGERTASSGRKPDKRVQERISRIINFLEGKVLSQDNTPVDRRTLIEIIFNKPFIEMSENEWLKSKSRAQRYLSIARKYIKGRHNESFNKTPEVGYKFLETPQEAREYITTVLRQMVGNEKSIIFLKNKFPTALEGGEVQNLITEAWKLITPLLTTKTSHESSNK